MNRKLSIPEWHQLAQEGTNIPVRIPLSGWSMVPLIRVNRDLVTVIPLDTTPQIGDIVMFSEQDGKRYVMHRVWDIKDGEVLTWGDNCLRPDGWIPLKNLWGKAVLIERGKRKIRPDAAKGIKWARFWHQAGIIYRPYIRCKYALKNKIDQLRVRVKK